MKKVLSALVLLALVGFAAPATAHVWGIPDNSPAATLLLPYFEVDLDDPVGTTTLFSINNASATAVLVHVVLWTDWSWHSLDFNIYLTGYDVQTVNIRDIFNGFLPVTASAGQDPGDAISPQGEFSQDINFASCTGVFPYDEPELGPFNLELIRSGHVGAPVAGLGARCVGFDHGDNVARGYITADTVNACSLLFPGDPGYFGAGGTGFATNQNVIWGDFFIVNTGENFAFGDSLVHIEAQSPGVTALPTVPLPTATGYTFYGRYTQPGGFDEREALGSVWATRFLNGGGFTGGTDLITWRDSTSATVPANGFSCASGPSWDPLLERQIVIFDEFEQPIVPDLCDVSPCPDGGGLNPFPLETQRVHVGGSALPMPYDFGWLYFDLNFPFNDAPTDDYDPNGYGDVSQSWMLTSHSASGRFQVGYPAMMLGLANNLPPTCIGDIGCQVIAP
jgi:hypothetical protein